MATDFSYQLAGSSSAFGQTKAKLSRLASADATVLIEGETGTGKEMVARALHYMGPRRHQPFVPVNCGALTEQLLESELFGHEKGAFTDAKFASLGLVHQAGGGTLFLDEVDALGHKAQAALLRFLQDGTYRRVGGAQLRQSDVRVVVASNADLKALAKERGFRMDLYYRVSVLSLQLPPLRERSNDVIELAHLFLARFARHYGCAVNTFTADSMPFAMQHTWPGNVRELENAVHRALLMAEAGEADLPLAVTGEDRRPDCAEGAHPALDFMQAKRRAVADFERRYIGELLARTQGNMTKAAVLAGQDRSAFGRLVRKHGLTPDRASTS